MVLDGLEDNEDFWNVAPSDDELPIVDSNQGHLGMGAHGCRDSRQDTAELSRVFNTDKREYCHTRPEMLPNGRYRYNGVYTLCCLLLHSFRCNHSCKDKSTCRHLWYASFLLHSINLTTSVCHKAAETVLKDPHPSRDSVVWYLGLGPIHQPQ
jgi:hypothetical protein